MLDALKTLLETNVISDDVKTSLEEAWNIKVAETKEILRKELREEYAKKFEQDKEVMVEALDTLVESRLKSEISELVEDRKQLSEMKAKYAVSIRKHANKLNGFVAERLAKEIGEFYADQKKTADNFSNLENFVVESLAKEITEFYTDKKDLTKTKVKLVKEARNEFNSLKSKFIKRSSALVEHIVEKTLSKEIKQLKEDIDSSRKKDFGRKIFEAFVNEYRSSLLNEKTEVSKLLKTLSKKNKELAEAKQILSDKDKLVEAKERTIMEAKDALVRKDILNELLSPLNKDHKEIMSDLLEGIQTNKLRTSYDKYLPAVLSENKVPRTKKPLTESTEITGDKTKIGQNDNIVEIRRLAGLN